MCPVVGVVTTLVTLVVWCLRGTSRITFVRGRRSCIHIRVLKLPECLGQIERRNRAVIEHHNAHSDEKDYVVNDVHARNRFTVIDISL